jgi:hypothetical protein
VKTVAKTSRGTLRALAPFTRPSRVGLLFTTHLRFLRQSFSTAHYAVDMPHSTISDPVDTSSQAEINEVLPDAPAQTLNDLKEEADQDASKSNDSTNQASKADVKLEDLFNDNDEDDDEFPSPRPTAEALETSPPAAPW